MKKRVKDNLSHWIFLLVTLMPFNGFADHTPETTGGPIDFTNASKNLAELFILATSHESVTSTEDFGKMWGTYSEKSAWEESYAWEFGASLLTIPFNTTIRNSFHTFDIADSDLPSYLYIPRFHANKAFSKNLAFGGSALYSPDIALYGVGVNLTYTFWSTDSFYTGLLANYGGAWKSNFVNTTSAGVALAETFNYKRLDLFAGISYVAGNADFTASGNQEAFGRLNYETGFGESYFFGFSYMLFKHIWFSDQSIVFTGQVNYEKNLDTSFIAKITLKVPSSRVRTQDLVHK